MRFPKNKTHCFLGRRQNDKWITVHPNGKDAKGRPALIDGEGIVKGGMGGKFNGKNIKDARKGAESKADPNWSEKLKQIREIYDIPEKDESKKGPSDSEKEIKKEDPKEQPKEQPKNQKPVPDDPKWENYETGYWNGSVYSGNRVYIDGKKLEFESRDKLNKFIKYREEAKNYRAKLANDPNNTYLSVPYEDKGFAREHGAKWNSTKKQWYVPAGKEIPEQLKKYAQDSDETKARVAEKEQRKAAASNPKNTFLNVPYDDKDFARKHGAKWNSVAKKWYIPAGTEVPEQLKKYTNMPSGQSEFDRINRQKIQEYGGQVWDEDLERAAYYRSSQKEKAYDNLHNEGYAGGGYNPYREDREFDGLLKAQKAREGEVIAAKDKIHGDDYQKLLKHASASEDDFREIFKAVLSGKRFDEAVDERSKKAFESMWGK